MMKAYADFWRRYTDFRGRTSVGGYWWTVLAQFIVGMVLSLIAVVLRIVGSPMQMILSMQMAFFLVCLPASLSIVVRRLRDAGLSWVNIFWVFLPLAGAIVLIVKLCRPTASVSVQAAPGYAAVPGYLPSAPGNPAAVPGYPPAAGVFSSYPNVQSGSVPSSSGFGKPSPVFSGAGSFAQITESPALFRKVPLASLQPYSGTGVCDVCNKPLSGNAAYIVPNDVFYRSPEWRERCRRLHTAFGMTPAQADHFIDKMRQEDKSAGSAVCRDCIHMFAD